MDIVSIAIAKKGAKVYTDAIAATKADKSNTYTKSEVDRMLADVIQYVVVEELPETGSVGIIYLLPNDGSEPNIYDEYIWNTDPPKWEKIGTTEVDLTGYATETWVTTQISNATDDCLKEPSSGLAVGKYFRVASIDSDGHAVLEACDPPSAPIQSVSTAGTALTPDANGNVDILISESNNQIGCLKPFCDGNGYQSGYGGIAYVQGAHRVYGTAVSWWGWSSRAEQNEGFAKALVSLGNLDKAVRCAMTDGVGAAWTDAERLAALQRMGCTVDSNGFVKWAAQQEE